MSIKAPTIISSNLSEVVQYCGYDVSAIKGAQACVEIYFSNPDLIDTIYITPNYSKGLQLLQAVIFEEDQVVGIDPVIENPITLSTIERTSQNSLIKLALNSPVLIDTIKEISFEKNQEKVGKTFKVLVDKKEAGRYLGRTEFDSVEVDNEVVINTPKALPIGEFVQVKITKAFDYDLEGDVIS